MRAVSARLIAESVAKLCIESNNRLPADVEAAIKGAILTEESYIARSILMALVKNMECATETGLPLCQDTGLTTVFIELGQEVQITDGQLRECVDEGVRTGYLGGKLRCSVVADPIRRVNTGDNTPAALYLDIVPGDRIKITVAPKGFGSENMCALRMFSPSASIYDIESFVVETVKNAGANPCPPVIVGVGIGGTADTALLMSKKALLSPLNRRNEDELYADMEREILEAINKLGIGPQGMGGSTTALGCSIQTLPTHIAGLPCGVSIGCHVSRHAEIIL